MWIVRVSALLLAGGGLFAQPQGNAARGQAVMEGKGNCLTCHRIKQTGSRFGPDLSEIGARTPAQLLMSLTDPDAEILPANRPYRVVLKDGATVDGRLLNEDTFTVQIIDTKENLRSFTKTDLRSFGIQTKSPMPSFKGRLSDQELADVVEYLGSLKPPPGAGRGGRGPAAAPAAEPH
ncbi:MAG TPA: c-type cytochrome [Bryobacteraceae bacterium]|jgi:putative heme-binding domain-containing protein